MLWPQAMAGVVGYARHPTTPRWLLPAPPLLIQGGESWRTGRNDVIQGDISNAALLCEVVQ